MAESKVILANDDIYGPSKSRSRGDYRRQRNFLTDGVGVLCGITDFKD